MLLAIDLGNTNLTIGLFEGTELRHTFRATSDRSRTADEYAVLLRQLLTVHRIAAQAVDAAILASVVPPLTEPVARAVETSFGLKPAIVGPGMKTGVSVLYDNPHEVGADRIVNAVAAYERAGGSAIVVDLGTATTFDCIGDTGEYLGGVIAPGVQVSLNALMEKAAKLRPIEIAVPPRVLGRNTAHSLQAGVIYGYSSLIDGVVERLRAEMNDVKLVIATGGLAGILAPYAKTVDAVDQDLTLVGLRLLHERNDRR